MNGHYIHDNAQAPNLVLAHTLFGEPVTASLPAGAVAGAGNEQANVGRATWSTAPYKPPSRRVNDRGAKLCAHEGCAAYPSPSIGDGSLCVGHGRAALQGCAKVGCKSIPKKGQDYCHWHKPKERDGDPQ